MQFQQEEHLLDILGMSHRYGFVELETSISEYLKAILNIRNVCLIYDLANIYSLKSLCYVCKEFMDRNAAHILHSEAFLGLSQVSELPHLCLMDFLAIDRIHFEFHGYWVVSFHFFQILKVHPVSKQFRIRSDAAFFGV